MKSMVKACSSKLATLFDAAKGKCGKDNKDDKDSKEQEAQAQKALCNSVGMLVCSFVVWLRFRDINASILYMST